MTLSTASVQDTKRGWKQQRPSEPGTKVDPTAEVEVVVVPYRRVAERVSDIRARIACSKQSSRAKNILNCIVVSDAMPTPEELVFHVGSLNHHWWVQGIVVHSHPQGTEEGGRQQAQMRRAGVGGGSANAAYLRR